MPDFAQFRILVDTPSANPGLNFHAYASALAHAINHSRPQFAIGIYGAWGSGKTTLMQTVKAGLSTANSVVVEFSAWRYEKEEYLLIPMLDTIREGLLAWANSQKHAADGASVMRVVTNAATMIGKVVTSIVAGISFKVGMPGSAELSFEAAKALETARAFPAAPSGHTDLQRLVSERGTATFPQSIYHTCFRELQKVFTVLRKEFTDLRSNQGDLRFVVFIDDLDRCLPAGALEVLESIKLFFEHEGFVFVVGLDRAIVERFIEQRYPEIVIREQARATTPGAAPPLPIERRVPLISGADYIKKIFQVPFTLAPVQLSQLEDLIWAIEAAGELSVDQVADLRARVLPHLRVALSETAVNPREVKRFINAYVLQMKIKQHLDPDVVLALQTINMRQDWDRVRQAVEVHRDEFMRALREQLMPVPVAVPAASVADDLNLRPLELLDPELANLPSSFLEYVAPAVGVARQFLDANEGARIEEYLYSVESTGNSHGAVLLDVLPLLAKARTQARSAENKLAATAAANFSRAQDHLRSARSILGSLETFPATRSLAQQLEQLADAMVVPPEQGLGGSEIKDASQRYARDIEDLARRVRALRRQDNLTTVPA